MGAGPSVEDKIFALTDEGNRIVFTFNVTEFLNEMKEKAEKSIPDDILQKAQQEGKEALIREQWDRLISKTKEKIAEMEATPPTPKDLGSLYRKMYQEQSKTERKALEKYWAERQASAKLLNRPGPEPLPEENKNIHPGIFIGIVGEYNLNAMQLVYIGYNQSFIAEKYARTVFVSPAELASLKTLPGAVVPDDCDYGVILPAGTIVNPSVVDSQGRPMPFEYTQVPTPDTENNEHTGTGCACGRSHGRFTADPDGRGFGGSSVFGTGSGTGTSELTRQLASAANRYITRTGSGAPSVAQQVVNDILREDPDPTDMDESDQESDDGNMTFTFK